jgi:microsomal epoxide hydrolase
MTDVNGVHIHFVGLFSKKEDAIPVLWLHGWPGEFRFLCVVLGKFEAQRF